MNAIIVTWSICIVKIRIVEDNPQNDTDYPKVTMSHGINSLHVASDA